MFLKDSPRSFPWFCQWARRLNFAKGAAIPGNHDGVRSGWRYPTCCGSICQTDTDPTVENQREAQKALSKYLVNMVKENGGAVGLATRDLLLAFERVGAQGRDRVHFARMPGALGGFGRHPGVQLFVQYRPAHPVPDPLVYDGMVLKLSTRDFVKPQIKFPRVFSSDVGAAQSFDDDNWTAMVISGCMRVVVRKLQHRVVDGTTLEVLGVELHDEPDFVVEVGSNWVVQ